MLSDKLPILPWGPRKLRAWAGQLCDVSDARQPVPDDSSIVITERIDGRGLSVAPWVYNGTSGNSNGRATKTAFGWYNVAFTGTGTPPANQGLMVAFYEGTINADIVPTNMGSVFTLQNNQTQYLRCTTSQNAQGEVIAAALDVTLTMDADPVGVPDVAPATSSRALWKFTTVDNAITDSIALRIGGLDVTAFPVDMACGSVTLRMFWGPGIRDA